MTISKPKPKMTADEFIVWAMDQTSSRHELIAGEIVAMAPERMAHARAKGAVYRALGDAIAAKGLPCEALPDGVALRIDDATVYEPDAALRCGARLDDAAVDYHDPIVVVEVLSPSTRAYDSGAKLEDYFRLPTLTHYLIVRTDSHSVIHHHRGEDGAISTRIVREGVLTLDPPGVSIEVAAIFDG